jgi:hypothetical protein
LQDVKHFVIAAIFLPECVKMRQRRGEHAGAAFISPMADKYQGTAIFFQLNCHACLFTEVESLAQDYGNSIKILSLSHACFQSFLWTNPT